MILTLFFSFKIIISIFRNVLISDENEKRLALREKHKEVEFEKKYSVNLKLNKQNNDDEEKHYVPLQRILTD